jgi:hypothetical protein
LVVFREYPLEHHHSLGLRRVTGVIAVIVGSGGLITVVVVVVVVVVGVIVVMLMAVVVAVESAHVVTPLPNRVK